MSNTALLTTKAAPLELVDDVILRSRLRDTTLSSKQGIESACTNEVGNSTTPQSTGES